MRTHLAQRAEGRVVDIVELADPVFSQRPVFFAGLVRIAKEPDEQLIDSHAGARGIEAAARSDQFGGGRIDIDLMIIRDVLVAIAAGDSRIGATPEFSPTVIFPKVLRVNQEIEFERVAEVAPPQTKNNRVAFEGNAASVADRAIAPFPVFPSTLITTELSLIGRGEEKQIGFERKENS